MTLMPPYIYAALLILTSLVWLSWFWRGIAYRGGFSAAGAPTTPLLLTILCYVVATS